MFTTECAVRLSFFLGVLAVLAVAEFLAPRRRLSVRKSSRWVNNLALVFLNTIAARLLLPVSAVALAVVAEERGWGLCNNFAVPAWLSILLSVVALDLVIYLQHVLFHAVPALWRIHLVHHADLDFDASTGLRFHTLEILLSMAIKLAAVVVLGAPMVAVVCFEILLNASSIFSHSNLKLPGSLDRILRFVIVTPDMHRVHHSVDDLETNSNFGFNVPWWDYLFGTYRAQPALGHERMTIGLAQFQDERAEKLHWMLALPFLGRLGRRVTAQRTQWFARSEKTVPSDKHALSA